MRADIALNQKKTLHDVTLEGEEDQDFEKEYLAVSAQVVSTQSNDERDRKLI